MHNPAEPDFRRTHGGTSLLARFALHAGTGYPETDSGRMPGEGCMDTAGRADRPVPGAGMPSPRTVGPDGFSGDWDLERVFRELSETPRWLGQATDRGGRTLTVAHHSLWCSRAAWRLLRDRNRGLRAGTALWALLHDCHEAWTGDVPRTLQMRMPPLLAMQDRIDRMILRRIAEERPGLAEWAGGRKWSGDAVERVDRAASAAEAHLYVDPSGLLDSNGMLQEPRRPPPGWPEMPKRLPGPKRAAAAMREGFALLAGMLEGMPRRVDPAGD